MARQSVLLQHTPSAEVRAVRTACMLLDGVDLFTAPMEGISGYQRPLERGEMMPVGSVEFVSEAMSVAGIEPPAGPGYPTALRPWLHREIVCTTLSKVLSAQERCFVKPVETKQFNGFVFDPRAPRGQLAEFEREQLDVLARLKHETPVWTSSVVHFVSEWRYYVRDGRVIGQARYDPDGPDDAPAPDRKEVERAVAAYGCATPFAIDMGVLAGGQTALVELHDAWAIGLYGHALHPRDYYAFLRSYWDNLFQFPHRKAP